MIWTPLNTNYRFLFTVVATSSLQMADYWKMGYLCNVHTRLKTQVLFRSLRLSIIGPCQYFNGWPPVAHPGCCFWKSTIVHHWFWGGISFGIWSNYHSRMGPLSGFDNAPECVIIGIVCSHCIAALIKDINICVGPPSMEYTWES